MRRMDWGFPGVYLSDKDIAEGFKVILDKDVPGLEIALQVMRMRLDSRLLTSGGYPADIDLSHPMVVAVANVQGSDENEPIALVYSRRRLECAGKNIQADARGLLQEAKQKGGRIDWGEYIWEQVDFDHCLWRRKAENKTDDSQHIPGSDRDTNGASPAS